MGIRKKTIAKICCCLLLPFGFVLDVVTSLLWLVNAVVSIAFATLCCCLCCYSPTPVFLNNLIMYINGFWFGWTSGWCCGFYWPCCPCKSNFATWKGRSDWLMRGRVFPCCKPKQSFIASYFVWVWFVLVSVTLLTIAIIVGSVIAIIVIIIIIIVLTVLFITGSGGTGAGVCSACGAGCATLCTSIGVCCAATGEACATCCVIGATPEIILCGCTVLAATPEAFPICIIIPCYCCWGICILIKKCCEGILEGLRELKKFIEKILYNCCVCSYDRNTNNPVYKVIPAERKRHKFNQAINDQFSPI